MASNLGSAMYFAWIGDVIGFVIFMFWVFVSGTYSLLINDIALRLRASSSDGGTEDFDRYSPGFIAATLKEIQSGVNGLDRGQLLILKFLEDILNNQKLKPDSAIIKSTSQIVFPKQWRPKN